MAEVDGQHALQLGVQALNAGRVDVATATARFEQKQRLGVGGGDGASIRPERLRMQRDGLAYGGGQLASTTGGGVRATARRRASTPRPYTSPICHRMKL